METARNLVPSEVHHGHEGRFHEEGDDALDGQWCAEDVAHEPRVVAPVGAKLKFEDDTRGDAHGEVDAEEFLPELGSVFPEGVFGAIVARLHDTHDDGQAERQGYEEPMVDCREGELCPRPLNGAGID